MAGVLSDDGFVLGAVLKTEDLGLAVEKGALPEHPVESVGKVLKSELLPHHGDLQDDLSSKGLQLHGQRVETGSDHVLSGSVPGPDDLVPHHPLGLELSGALSGFDFVGHGVADSSDLASDSVGDSLQSSVSDGSEVVEPLDELGFVSSELGSDSLGHDVEQVSGFLLLLMHDEPLDLLDPELGVLQSLVQVPDSGDDLAHPGHSDLSSGDDLLADAHGLVQDHPQLHDVGPGDHHLASGPVDSLQLLGGLLLADSLLSAGQDVALDLDLAQFLSLQGQLLGELLEQSLELADEAAGLLLLEDLSCVLVPVGRDLVLLLDESPLGSLDGSSQMGSELEQTGSGDESPLDGSVGVESDELDQALSLAGLVVGEQRAEVVPESVLGLHDAGLSVLEVRDVEALVLVVAELSSELVADGLAVLPAVFEGDLESLGFVEQDVQPELGVVQQGLEQVELPAAVDGLLQDLSLEEGDLGPQLLDQLHDAQLLLFDDLLLPESLDGFLLERTLRQLLGVDVELAVLLEEPVLDEGGSLKLFEDRGLVESEPVEELLSASVVDLEALDELDLEALLGPFPAVLVHLVFFLEEHLGTGEGLLLLEADHSEVVSQRFPGSGDLAESLDSDDVGP